MRGSRVLSGLSGAAGILALLVGVGGAPAVAEPRVAVTRVPVDLGTLPGDTNSDTTAINDNGTITGVSWNGGFYHPVRWSANGTITQLSIPDGSFLGWTVDVNASDTVIGYWKDENSRSHAATWDASGGRTDLPVPPGTIASTVDDINDAGTMVGFVGSVQNGGAIRWNADGTSTVLPLPPGGMGGRAVAINEAGVITGFCNVSEGGLHALRWTPDGVLTDLGTLGGRDSQPIDINERGVVIGNSQVPAGGTRPVYHAVRWEPTGAITDLGVTPRYNGSNAIAVNDAGTVVGASGVFPVQWPADTPVELPLRPGDTQGSAYDVNNSGVTAGVSGSSAVLWDAAGNISILLGLPGAGTAKSNAINDHGRVVGFAQTAAGARHAVRW